MTYKHYTTAKVDINMTGNYLFWGLITPELAVQILNYNKKIIEQHYFKFYNII